MYSIEYVEVGSNRLSGSLTKNTLTPSVRVSKFTGSPSSSYMPTIRAVVGMPATYMGESSSTANTPRSSPYCVDVAFSENTIRNMHRSATNVLTDIPAVYMSIWTRRGCFLISSSLGSTKAPTGTTAYSRPVESTLEPLARVCIPWPISCTTIAMHRARTP